MKKNITRLFSVLLAAVLVFGTLPVSAMGTDVADPPASTVDDTAVAASTAEPEESSAADETSDDAAQPEEQSAEEESAVTYASSDDFYKIVHLDCGRKYFSKDWIIALLYEMQYDGYNQLQLAFGNDGLRFLLDDMSFTANGTTYSHETVVSKVEAGNEAQNNSGDERWLSQKEMDAIVAKANELGIEIVPLLNLPGHANAILDIADDAYNASGYNSWYQTVKSDNTLDTSSASAKAFAMEIFKKYVNYFAGKGCKFFNFGADEYVNDLGDSPAFSFSRLSNDEYQNFTSFINDMAEYIVGKGMTPRAFNDGLYYGRSSKYTMDTSKYTAIKEIQCCYWSSGWNSYPVAYASTISDNGHAMINTNGDYYYVLGKDDKFTPGKRADGQPEGVDADYTRHESGLYTAAGDFNNTVFSGDNVISNPAGSMFCIWADYPNFETEQEVAANTRLVLRAMAQRMNNKDVDVDTSVIANGFKEDGSINSSSENPDPDPTPDPTPDDSLLTISIGDTVAAAGSVALNGTLTLKASRKATWTADPADAVRIESTGGVATQSDDVTAQEVTVTALKAGEVTITATENESSKATFVLTASETEPKEVAVAVGGTTTRTIDGDVRETIGNYDTEVTNISATYPTKVTQIVYDKVNFTGDAQTVEYLSTNSNDKAPEKLKLTIEREKSYGNGYYYYIKNSENKYLSLNGSNIEYWDYKYSSQNRVNLAIEDGSGVVSSANSSTKRYLTIKDGEFALTTDETKLYAFEPKTAEVDSEISTITFTGKKEGDTYVTIGGTLYHVTVVARAIGEATLTIQYWITNRQVEGSDGQNQKEITGVDAYGINGAAIEDLVPATGTYDENSMVFWKATRLDSENHQTTEKGVDKTLAGTDFKRIRYYNNVWSYLVGENWTPFSDGDQVVAYYMQVTDVTKEITTEVVDWGPLRTNYTDARYVLLDFAVKYESSDDRVPDSFPNDKTIAFHCNNKDGDTSTVHEDENGVLYRTIGRINAVETADYEVYMITLTPNTDTANSYLSSGSGNSAIKDGGITYAGTEKVVWVDDEANLGEFAGKETAPGYTVGGEPSVSSINIYYQHAMLVTYYLRAKSNDDSLKVYYADNKTGEKFHEVTINVKNGVTFSPNIGLGTDPNGYLVNGNVKNTMGRTERVTASLAGVTTIPNQYRYAAYTAVRVEKSDDLKTVTIYYDFDNTASFVIDFGTPVEIPLIDIAPTATAITKDQVEITGQTHGSAEVVESDGAVAIKFKPDNRFTSSEQGETLTVTINDGTIKSSYIAYIYPASNVLYEEDFLTDNKVEGSGWTKEEGSHTTAQETQKAKEENSPFGYDPSYAGDGTYTAVTGENGAWTIENLIPKKRSVALTTEFYGNTFDLIGNCGPTTGRVMLLFKRTDGSYAAVVDIDTRYTKKDIYQVPLAHITLDDGKDANYSVIIYASGLAATTASTQAIATMAMDDAVAANDELLTQILEENGLTLDDVDYISTSVMQEGVEAASPVATMSLDDAATYASVAHQAGDHVEINGFRVYRSTNVPENSDATTDTGIASNYPASEQNKNYWNVLDVAKGVLVNAYVDNETVDSISVKRYESAGGPQNEIYLPAGSAVSFKLNNEDITSIQVSLRAVDTETEWNNTPIQTNTELYYTLEIDPNTKMFTILNTATATADDQKLLAIGNVKLPSSVQDDDIISAEDVSEETVLASIRSAYGSGAEEPEVFTPGTFTAKTTATKVIRNKVVTLKVTVSNDVAYVTINGVKYTRTGFQNAFNKNRTILVVNTVPKNETKTYEIVAYNADGVASETMTVTG